MSHRLPHLSISPSPVVFNHNFSYPGFVRFRTAQHSFTDVFAYESVQASLSQSSGAEIVAGEIVSGSYFETLGVRLRFGRALTDDDSRPGAPPAAVIDETFWRLLFGGSTELANRTIRLNGTTFAVIGVSGEPFHGMEVGRRARFWAPLSAQPILDPSGGESYLTRAGVNWLTLMGRLRSDVLFAHRHRSINRESS